MGERELSPDEGLIAVQMHDDRVFQIAVPLSWWRSLTSDQQLGFLT